MEVAVPKIDAYAVSGRTAGRIPHLTTFALSAVFLLAYPAVIAVTPIAVRRH
jgi:hypothetical protein